MATFKRACSWNRWAGPISDLAAASRLAVAEIAKWSDEGKGTAEYRVEVRTPSLIATFDDVRALESLGIDFDLQRLTSLRIDVTLGRLLSDEATRIELAKHPLPLSPALELTVSGKDRTRVDGLFARLSERLGQGGLKPSWYQRWVLSLLVLPTFFLAIPGLDVAQALGLGQRDGRWQVGEVLGIVGLPSLTLAFLLLLGWLTPELQLLPEAGGRTRFRRFRSLFLGFLLAVLASLIAAVVYGRLHNG